MKNFAILFFLLCSFVSEAQYMTPDPPVIGRPSPDFTLRNIDNYSVRDVSLADLKGKYVILGFWSKNCAGCISSFPKFSKIQKKYRDKGLEIIMVAWDEPLVNELWKTYKKKLNLQMANVFDTSLFKKMNIENSGVNVWINKNGVIKAVNTDEDLTDENIRLFLSDKEFVSKSDYSQEGRCKLKQTYDYLQPMFLKGNGGEDTCYDFRSVISVWKVGQPHLYLYNIDGHINTKEHYQKEGVVKRDYPFMGVPLESLYDVAYTGGQKFWGRDDNDKFWGNKPTIEVNDLKKFNEINKQEYNYAVYLPPSKLTKANLMRKMQHDLEDYFGYKGVIDYRDIPCFDLVVKDEVLAHERLAVEDSIAFVSTPSVLNVFNWSVRNLCFMLGSYLPNGPVINKTNISSNISIQLKDVVRSDWRDLKRALNAIGLDLLPSTVHVKTLVIKDVDSN